MSDITRRKQEHLDVVLSGAAQARAVSTGFEEMRFEHVSLPELKLSDIDLSTGFLGRSVAAPLFISSMTGGPEKAEQINRTIAEAASHLKIGFGVGSQRVALEGEAARGFDLSLRQIAGPVPILANFGAAQLKNWKGPDMMRRAVEMIDADALIIHLNPLQEAVQHGGDTDWTDILGKIEQLAREGGFPVVVKEVGFGISGTIARALVDAGAHAIDVAGAGGTSWAAVEAGRAKSEQAKRIAEGFRDWGIPTARAIKDVRAACPQTTVIASGGIRDGLDVAKAMHLGADLAAQAAGVLAGAISGPDALIDHLECVITQLRIACFCTGSAAPADLRHATLL